MGSWAVDAPMRSTASPGASRSAVAHRPWWLARRPSTPSTTPSTLSKPMRARRMRRLVLASRVRHQDDGLVGPDHVAGVLGEAALEAHVHRTRQVGRREALAVAAVDQHSAVLDVLQRLFEGEAGGGRRVVEQVVAPAVRRGGEHEVGRRHRLAAGDGLDELVLGHRGQRRVGAALLADRRPVRRREVLATGGSGAVSGEDDRVIGEGQDLVLQRAVQAAGQVVRRPADRGEKVGASDVADEEGVAGEDRPRVAAVRRVGPHDDRDRLRSVTGGVAHLEHDLPQLETLAVDQHVHGEVGLGAGPERDRRSGGVGQLEVAGQEIRVEVGLDHPLDREAVPLGVGEVHADVALGVDDDGAAGGLVADQVAELREATQLVLLEDHARSSLRSRRNVLPT
ncbi:MAG: hypothetical protein V9E94_14450 [Microthrixaceae bacterium]